MDELEIKVGTADGEMTTFVVHPSGGGPFPVVVASVKPDAVVAAAGIHPGALVTDQPDSPHRDLTSVRGELYIAFAENDHSAMPENVERVREELSAQGVEGVVERVGA